MDVRCGGGVRLPPPAAGRPLRYVAAQTFADDAAAGLPEADRRGLHWIEFTEADIEALRVRRSTSFDLIVAYGEASWLLP